MAARQQSNNSKQANQVPTNFMKRRVSENKVGEISGKLKPISATRGNTIAYAEYLDHNKARSPKIYPSKQLEQLKQVQGSTTQLTQT